MMITYGFRRNTAVSILIRFFNHLYTYLQANPASSETTSPREKRGFIDNQQPPILSVSSSVLACQRTCVDAFIAKIHTLEHYSYLVSPFVIFRRIWDAYDNLDKCQRTCLGKTITLTTIAVMVQV